MSSRPPLSESRPYRKLGTDPMLINLFCQEVRIQLDILNPNLIRLEAEGFQSEILEGMMRAAHSLKGAARMVHIDLAVGLTHELENYFVHLQKIQSTPDASGCDVVFQSIDALESIAARLHHFPDDDLSQEASTVLTCVRAIANLMDPISVEANPSQTKPNQDQLSQTKISPDNPANNPFVPDVESFRNTPSIEALDHTSGQSTVEPIPHRTEHYLKIKELKATDNSQTNQSPFVKASPTIDPQDEFRTSESERTVRLSRENLSRLMGLVGESLTEATWLEPFGRSLLDLKTQQARLIELLDSLQAQLPPNEPKFHNLLSQARDQANRCRRDLLDRTTELEEYASRSSQLANHLYQEVIESQMRPFSDIGLGFPRMVRDLARQVNKQIKLEVVGKHTSVDRDILEHLEAPLIHLLRNAIDHGIESPADRQTLGKPAYGTITVTARHRAGNLIITVEDDGRGIHSDHLREHILKRQLATPEMVYQLSHSELMAFLYLPGFSTNDRVTELSGRGVGLDVVHTLVQNVGGTLTVQSEPGKSTTFSLHLPLTRSLLRTLMVEIAGHPYAFPMTRIDRITHLSPEAIQYSENRPYFLQDQQSIGLIPTHDILNLPHTAPQNQTLTLLQMSDQQFRYGLIVDRILGEEKLVVKPMHRRLGKVPNLSATALRSDGTIAFIIDSEDFLQSIEKILSHPPHSALSLPTSNDPASSPIPQLKQILVVDDSITVRETERKLLENQGYIVDTAINGMDGWNALQFGQYDLLITDIDMPRMNGIELVHQVKRHPKLNKLPAIIISYKDREEDRMRGLEVGADYYLTKSSFHDDTLIQAVSDLIGVP